MFQSWLGSLLKSPLSLRKCKMFRWSISLSNLHYLYLNYHLLYWGRRAKANAEKKIYSSTLRRPQVSKFAFARKKGSSLTVLTLANSHKCSEQFLIHLNNPTIWFLCRMADGGEDCYSTSDLHFDVTVVDSSDGETDSDDVSEEFSEDDDVVNLCKIIKKFKFLCGSFNVCKWLSNWVSPVAPLRACWGLQRAGDRMEMQSNHCRLEHVSFLSNYR